MNKAFNNAKGWWDVFFGDHSPTLVSPVPTGGLQAHNIQPEPPGPFKYSMGQSDYNWVRPQLEKLLTTRQSPLADLLDEFIKAGNKYGVDPRVLPTIANNESSLAKNYPIDTFNPFGYLVNGLGVEGLRNAGFTSLPHAIDALTGRFARQPTENYQKFYQDPTISNLQMAYNANPAERETYLTNANDLLQFFQ